ncbi:MAG: hypothetical protein WCP06_10160 [Verrucomicrobiota bacterium]
MNSNEPFLDLPEGDELSAEQLDAQVQKAQDQLVALKRQQEIIEKQKRELEELSRRQEQLQQGRMEMMEKFTRAAVVLERETFDAQKRVEQLRDIQDAFAQHMHVLESINPKGWEGADINRELNRSLSAVDDARAEYSKSLPKIQPDLPAGESDEEPGYASEPIGYNFIYWLKSGFAFTLPLFILGLVVALILLLR